MKAGCQGLFFYLWFILARVSVLWGWNSSGQRSFLRNKLLLILPTKVIFVDKKDWERINKTTAGHFYVKPQTFITMISLFSVFFAVLLNCILGISSRSYTRQLISFSQYKLVYNVCQGAFIDIILHFYTVFLYCISLLS